jgi:hypothetical protein
MYAHTYSKDFISFIISAWKMSGEPAIPIGNLLYEYLPQGKMIVQILDASGSNLIESIQPSELIEFIVC